MSRPLTNVLACLPAAVALSAMLFSSSGCNPLGCFPASDAGGACPSQEEALPYFGDPDCGGRVASVESDASFENGEPEEGALCCYEITNKEPEYTDCPDF